jgi:O-succinylbenzoate synthase
MKAFYFKHILNFHYPSGTSRGVLNQKESWFIVIYRENKTGVGECSLIKGLSPDPENNYEQTLKKVCDNISDGFDNLSSRLNSYPSILFGLETAFRSLESSDSVTLFSSEFTKNQDSIPINGLIWMGQKKFMISQIKEKINSGFDCVRNNVKWWATSALESNIGLNAIAQWVYEKHANMKQGLGTGELFSNNIPSPYIIEKGRLKYITKNKWDLSLFDQQKQLLL